MASEYLTGRGSSSHSAGDASASAAPGKRTLTGGLSPTFGVRAQDDAGASLGGLAFLSVTAARPGASEVDPFFFAQPGGVSPSAGVVDAAATVGLGDVSGVQLHVNAAAHELAASHDAHAVTFGQDIHFAAGAYAPETDAGARLLGHELAHAAQQRYATPVAAAKARTTSTGDTVENEADAAGESFLQALGGREVAPVRITPSVMAVARFQGAAPAARTLTQPPVGNQNAPGPTRDPIAAGRQAARNARRREARESDLEVPNPTIRPGGAPPDFVTVSDQSAQSTMGHDADVPHDSVIDFVPRFFHVVPAIHHDARMITSPDELLTIWTLYLLDEPQPAPWSGRVPGATLRNNPLKLPPEGGSDDEPNDSWVQPWNKMRLPPGTAAGQILRRMVRTRCQDDPGGVRRRSALIEACTARAREVESLQALIPQSTARQEVAAEANHRRRRPPSPKLVLPLGKAPYLGLYQNLAQARRLVHDPAYDRDTKQDRKWDAAMKVGGSHGISDALWREGSQLLSTLGRAYRPPGRGVYRPDWSRTKPNVSMQVDHIVELQVVAQVDQARYDSIENYELLEESANKSSGSVLMHAIKKEREELFRETGDRAYLDGPLTFESVILGSAGVLGERWRPEEIREGEHLITLRGLTLAAALGDASPW